MAQLVLGCEVAQGARRDVGHGEYADGPNGEPDGEDGGGDAPWRTATSGWTMYIWPERPAKPGQRLCRASASIVPNPHVSTMPETSASTSAAALGAPSGILGGTVVTR